jgi:tetratricopeptide (TPR) repeat protein
LQPLYQAVAHGCQAGRYEAACRDVYRDRICRGTSGPHAFYSTHKLGAIGADLAAVGCFFVTPWATPAPDLGEVPLPWLLNEAATRLQALGRLTDAREPMRAGIDLYAEQQCISEAAVTAGNLSQLELTLGNVAAAEAAARQSVDFANAGDDVFEQIKQRTKLADALHQAGRADDARRLDEEAEAKQKARQGDYPLLHSVMSFRFCDLLLADAERAAGRVTLECGESSRPANRVPTRARAVRRSVKKEKESGDPGATGPHSKTLAEVEQRATQTLQWVTSSQWLLDIALDHLTLGRAALYGAILEGAARESTERWQSAATHLDAAVQGLRDASQLDELPHGLLTRAWLRRVQGKTDLARQDLDEAWQIAERSSMRLFMTDVHLARLRLFGRTDPYPWRTHSDGTPRTPHDDLTAARRLITDCGYHRRDAELTDLESHFRNQKT